MALPVTISPAVVGTHNSYHGPFKSSGGNFYTLLPAVAGSSFVDAFKATDPTNSFAVQDTSNRPLMAGSEGPDAESFNVFQNGDNLHGLMQGENEEAYYARFDMSDNTWQDVDGAGNTEVLIDAAPDTAATACDIAVLSAAYGAGSAFVKIRVVYQGETDMDMGSNYERIDESNSVDDGVTWSAPTQIDNGASVAGLHYTGPRIVKHPSDDQVFVFMFDGADQNLTYRAIAGDDTLRTYRDSTFNVSVSTATYPITHGLGFIRSSTAKVRVGYYGTGGGDLHVLEFDAFTDDTNPTETDSVVSSENVQLDNNSINACLAADGSVIRGLMVKSSDDDLYEFFDDDADSYTLQGTRHGDAGTYNHISCNVYDRSGPKLAMIYDDGGTVKYDEIAITITESALSTVDMGQQNSFHGPFEI